MASFHCEECDYTTVRKANYERHMKSGKHKPKIEKPKKEYQCETCTYKTTNRGNFYSHKKNHEAKAEDDPKKNWADPKNKRLVYIQNYTRLSGRKRKILSQLRDPEADKVALHKELEKIEEEMKKLT